MFQKVKVFSLIPILIVILFLTGCLTTGLGPKFTQPIEPAPGKAIIYVYRQQGVMTAGTIPGIKINDSMGVKKLFEVSYFSLSVEPGQYTFAPKQFGIFKTTEATIDAVAGQIYFVRLKVSVGHLQFEQMNKDEAMAYMSTCYLLDPKYSLDSRVQASKSLRQL